MYYHHVHSYQDFNDWALFQQTQLNAMIRIFKTLTRSPTAVNNMNRFRFSGLPAAFLQTNQEKNTEIISLTVEEIQQLSSLNHYSNSVQYLTQNSLHESFAQLEFALNEAKNKYPWSINLHSCIMNRMSILTKLLNRKQKFESLLEELYLVSLSSKGPKSLDTAKNLINYLICLTIYSPKKCNAVLEYIAAEGVPEYVLFFDALNTIRERHEFKEGLNKMQELPDKFSYEKIFKYNNIAFMRVYCLREQYKNPAEYSRELKAQSKAILSIYLKTLLEAETNHENISQFTPEQNAQSQKLLAETRLYLNGESKELPTDKISPKRILKNSNSHIITMNIASLLFQLERLNECFYFLQITLEKAITENELQRVGIALTLLGRCYYLQGEQKWQQTYLDILDHSARYPKTVVKQTLATYSRLLFQQGRYYEAESYFNQSLTIQEEGGIEGLILPSYNFSF